VLLAVDAGDDAAPEPQPRLGQLVVRRVERDVAEPVDRERVRDQLAAVEPRGRQLERHELAGVERAPGLGQRRAPGERRRHRREQVAAVERRGHRAQTVRRPADLDRLDHAAELLGRRDEQAVVGPHEQPLLLGAAHRDRAAPPADLGVDDRQVHAGRRERQPAPQHQRPRADVVPRDAVRQVDHARVRGDARDHRVADADEVVVQSVVAEEGDHHEP
jgi:hypothetical protein